MDLPSFIWLWKIAAWAMGLSIFAYILLAFSGAWMLTRTMTHRARPLWLRPFHYSVGTIMGLLVLVLLVIGIVGTLGHYGNLGHSVHLTAGLAVVILVSISWWSANQISPQKPWARLVHIGTNAILFWGFLFVSVTGWQVVQKYLP